LRAKRSVLLPVYCGYRIQGSPLYIGAEDGLTPKRRFFLPQNTQKRKQNGDPELLHLRHFVFLQF
jgi:hypothetical protein